MQPSRSRTLLLTGALALLLGACGGDGVGWKGKTVGGPCATSDDCRERCLVGGDYPQGTCAVSCFSDRDCPSGTWCVDEAGGVCLLACELPQDCRPGYNCQGETNLGHGGDSLVCKE